MDDKVSDQVVCVQLLMTNGKELSGKSHHARVSPGRNAKDRHAALNIFCTFDNRSLTSPANTMKISPLQIINIHYGIVSCR